MTATTRRFGTNPLTARRIAAVLVALAPVATTACRTSTTRSEESAPGLTIARAMPVRAWAVRSGERTLGSLVRYEDPVDPSRALFVVRDHEQHDLGLVDVHGRAWRYVLHSREPKLLGTGTVAHATALIFAIEGEIELVELAIDDLRPPTAVAPK
ncbi:MAG: hypothetical protein ACKVWV_04400 [Planctomycetota bacterium]